MHVQSAPGRGSTFSFTSVHNSPTPEELGNILQEIKLEAIRGNTNGDVPAEALDTRANINGPPPKFRVIGVAEDNPINLKHLAKHLKMLGYESILCVNGKEIYTKFCEPDHSKMEAVIMDMSMPIMQVDQSLYSKISCLTQCRDGLEATRLIRAYEQSRKKEGFVSTPIIAL